MYLESHQLVALYHLYRNSIVGALTPCMPFVRMSCRNAVYELNCVTTPITKASVKRLHTVGLCVFLHLDLVFKNTAETFVLGCFYIDVYPVTPLGETMVKGCWSTGQKHAIQLVGVYWSSALHLTLNRFKYNTNNTINKGNNSNTASQQLLLLFKIYHFCSELQRNHRFF